MRTFYKVILLNLIFINIINVYWLSLDNQSQSSHDANDDDPQEQFLFHHGKTIDKPIKMKHTHKAEKLVESPKNPSTTTHTILMKAHVQKNDFEKANNLPKKMEPSKHTQPCQVTPNTPPDCACQTGDLQRVQGVSKQF